MQHNQERVLRRTTLEPTADKENVGGITREPIFQDASSAFREVNVRQFEAIKNNDGRDEPSRCVLGEIKNGQSSRKCNEKTGSPVAKRRCKPLLLMDALPKQVAEQKARQQRSGNKGHDGDPDTLLGKSTRQNLAANFGKPPPMQSQIGQPKVLHRATVPEPKPGTNGADGNGPSKAATEIHEKPATYADKVTQNEGRDKWGEIKTTFFHLRKTQPEQKEVVVRTVLDTQQLANRLDFLRRKTFVLYTVDVSPSRDVVAEWAEAILYQEMGSEVTRVRVLNKHCYLITVDKEEDMDLILEATPLYLGPHMVFALQWETTFDSANLETAKVPVWVELPNIHPCMEAFGPQLLKSIGEVLFTTCEETDCHYMSIKGCLRLDLSRELPELIEVVDPDTNETYLQLILYRSFPNACFSCHQRGHLVRHCPTRKLRRQAEKGTEGKGPAEKGDKQHEKAPAKSDTRSTDAKEKQDREARKGDRIISENPYAALGAEETEAEQNERESQDLHVEDQTDEDKRTEQTKETNEHAVNQEDMEVTKEKRKRQQEAEVADTNHPGDGLEIRDHGQASGPQAASASSPRRTYDITRGAGQKARGSREQRQASKNSR
ncbi:hypothetical protein R1sor_005150 [Riccia sorocarpa]|uniref:CCHC-type domain-containing protein n=1 Tax=Riccia sorocarpa TaxID=122646 RepID=A0ABD3HMA9_9MARC